jgi:hypothetical protein
MEGNWQSPIGNHQSLEQFLNLHGQKLLDDLARPATMVNALTKGGEIYLTQFLRRERLEGKLVVAGFLLVL